MDKIDWQGYRITAWVIVSMLGVLAIYEFFSQGWQNGLVLAGFVVGTACYLALAHSTPRAFAALLALAVAMNAAGWSWNLFQSVWGFDEAAHALGTLGATLILAWHGYRPILEALDRHPAVMALAVVALGVCLGALWEMLEWAGYQLFTTDKVQTLNDKIADLFCDGLGAVAGFGAFRWALSQRIGEAARQRWPESSAAPAGVARQPQT